MRFYAVVTLYINRSCFKLRFHDTEVFFDLPAAFVDVDDLADIPFQICDNGIKTVIRSFFPDPFSSIFDLFLPAKFSFYSLLVLCL